MKLYNYLKAFYHKRLINLNTRFRLIKKFTNFKSSFKLKYSRVVKLSLIKKTLYKLKY